MKKGGFSNNLKLSIPLAGEESITKFLYIYLNLLFIFLDRSIAKIHVYGESVCAFFFWGKLRVSVLSVERRAVRLKMEIFELTKMEFESSLKRSLKL